MIISLTRFLLQKRSFDLPGKVKKITINRSCILVIIWIIMQVCDPKHVQSMCSHAHKLARTPMKTFFFLYIYICLSHSSNLYLIENVCAHVHAGINPELLEKIQLPVPGQERSSYSHVLVERLIRIMNHAALPGTHTHTHFYYLRCRDAVVFIPLGPKKKKCNSTPRHFAC